MTRTGLLVIACLGLLEGAAAAKGGGIILPPAEIDLGASAPVGGGSAVDAGVEILAGVHWASLAWRPTKVDFGFGYVGSFRTLEPADVSARGEASPVEAPRLSLSGAYLAIGRTVVRQRHFRTWVELRGELLHARLGDRSFSSLGGAVRLSSEVFTAGGFAESRTNAVAVVAGALGLGVYVELSHRQLDDALGPTSVTTGISIRIPFVLIGAT